VTLHPSGPVPFRVIILRNWDGIGTENGGEMCIPTPILTSGAARILGKSPAQVRAMIRRGEFKRMQKLGGWFLLDQAEVTEKAKESTDWPHN
jgi:hypothetical protein